MAERVDPPNTPNDEEITVLRKLTALDVRLRTEAGHLGQEPGDGLIAWLTYIIQRETGSRF